MYTNLCAGLLLLKGLRPNKYFSNFSFSIEGGNPSAVILTPDGRINECDGTTGDEEKCSEGFTNFKLPRKDIFADGLKSQ